MRRLLASNVIGGLFSDGRDIQFDLACEVIRRIDLNLGYLVSRHFIVSTISISFGWDQGAIAVHQVGVCAIFSKTNLVGDRFRITVVLSLRCDVEANMTAILNRIIVKLTAALPSRNIRYAFNLDAHVAVGEMITHTIVQNFHTH
ncbi:Uncharacterised protein [Vibrio cholerae]|uniref:Uncharacterized protein n=1 Tax=Vibrio cholerae TaxID=666 RepID=A0A655UI59_VIBCL|nr:Uncharacterised protein [Vibrio cholerae]CSA07376.1 Uncharacterised protein [Vibrio cholerae]CSA78740.1 Uncharacterised protein [Vibrio cholerae]CSB09264.1 Uncharacterised protein [Vibrio cholerae]CSB50901.1 Uncharacterised protein [Vibrio cholerae]